MRPLELTLSGFRSYREPATFDFRGRHLVGVVGPNGAGKSSILDAIAFALYGKTPVVRSGTRSLIHQLEEELHVSLLFEVDGEMWRATRGLRRRGQAGHQLEHLDADAPDANVVETVVGEALMAERVERLLGLDFGAFCRSVLLAQDRFSEFLTASSGERDNVLKGVFGYERLGLAHAAARARMQQAEAELEVLAQRRHSIDEAREHLGAAREAADAAEGTLRTLQDVQPKIDELAGALARIEATVASVRAVIAETEAVAATLPKEKELSAAADAASDARSVVHAAADAVETAKEARAQRQAELADLNDRLGDRERFASFESLVVAHEQQVRAITEAQAALTRSAAAIDTQRAAVAGAERAVAVTAGEVEAADLASADADRAAADAREALEVALHAEMAHELRAGLSVGGDCPVCGQTVAVVPKGRPKGTVKAAKTALKKAEAAQQAGQDGRRTAASAHAAAAASLLAARDAVTAGEAEHERVAEAAAEAEAADVATRSQLAEWLGEEGDPRALFNARSAERAAAETAVHEASLAWEAARADLDRAGERAKDADARLTAIAAQLSNAWGRLGEQRDVPPEPDGIRATFVEIGSTLVERHDDAVAAGAEAASQREDAERDRSSLLAGVGLAPKDDLARAIADAAARHGALAQQVEDLSSRIEGADELERDVQEAERRRDITRRLSDDLRPSQFLAYLLEEERADLAALGSAHFEQLTGGHFRFTDDATFGIVDRNAAGSERKAESLSGGERFLASLALAIALAEMVTRGGGLLDAFFLDEGFGSLDPEHLDLAMDGIGRLVADDVGRLVVLVSHVAEMREAIDDLIVLDKDGLSGDAVVVAGARPI